MIHLPRLTFVAYAIVLFVATHWPRLAAPGSGIRVDLAIHASVFGLWNLLCMMAAWFGPRWSRRNIIGSTIAASLAGVADEISQSLPIFDRVFGFDDMTANLCGALAAGILAGFLMSKSQKRAKTGPHPKGNT